MRSTTRRASRSVTADGAWRPATGLAAKSIFIDLGYSERGSDPTVDHTVLDLPAVAAWILSRTQMEDDLNDEPSRP